MALTRKFLKSLGLDEDKVDSIIEAHTESTDALKKQRDEAADKIAELESITKERDSLKAQLEKAGDAAKVQAEFDAYKDSVAKEKANAGKKSAVIAALKNAGVAREEFVDLLIGKIDMEQVEMDGETAKNADALIEPLKASYSGCFGKTETLGTPPVAPPSGGGKTFTREQLKNMSADEINANWDAVQSALKGV